MAISPGWPIIEAGMWLYREHYNQKPMQGQSSAWWLRWIGEVWPSTKARDLRKRLQNEGNLYYYAFNMIAPRAKELVVAEENQPAYKQPDVDYTTHFVGKDTLGWTIPQQDWPAFITRIFNWVITQVRTGKLGTRYLDVALFETVQKGAAKASLPIWLPPTKGAYPSDEESAVWYSYMRKTGYLDIQKSLSQEISSVLQQKKKDGRRWMDVLNTADTVVGWVSMTEPVRILMRKAEELTDKYTQAKQTLNKARSTMAEVEGLDPAYTAKLDRLERSIDAEAMPAFDVLNPVGMWNAETPSQLGAVPVAAIYGGAALLAVGVVSVALASVVGMLTDAQRTGAAIARDAQNILQQRIDAATGAFDREEAVLKNKLIAGEITQDQYDQGLIDVNQRRQKKLDRLQREASEVLKDVPTGSMFGSLGLGAVLGGVALGAILFRKQIAGGVRQLRGR